MSKFPSSALDDSHALVVVNAVPCMAGVVTQTHTVERVASRDLVLGAPLPMLAQVHLQLLQTLVPAVSLLLEDLVSLQCMLVCCLMDVLYSWTKWRIIQK